MKQPSNDAVKTPPPTPDAMTQFGNLLERYSNADNLARHHPDAGRDSTLVLASGMFCIAAELRRIHDVLHEINQRDEAHRSQEAI